MKKITLLFSAILFVLSFNTFCFGQTAQSGAASAEASAASGHASKSAAHAIAASGRVTSAASAVPFAILGVSGAVSAKMAQDLNNAASRPVGAPLEITEETVTAGPPPDKALQKN